MDVFWLNNIYAFLSALMSCQLAYLWASMYKDELWWTWGYLWESPLAYYILKSALLLNTFSSYFL